LFSRSRFRGQAAGYKSGLEEETSAWLKERGIDGRYEAKDDVITYVTPATTHKYKRDFRLPNGIIIETKGRFLASDRKKHLLIKQQHPHLDIRFVFSRAKAPITKGSKTTCAMWADKNGFKWAEKRIPEAWLKEKAK
jgi:hypothetical protein